MANPSVIQSGVGFRNLRVFALNDAGLPIPAAKGAVAYEGLLVSGVRQMNVNDPEPRLIVHVGDDAPFELDSLPPLDPVTGSLQTSKQNDTLDALLTGQKSFVPATGAEQELFGVGTDKRGFEVQVGAVMYRQSLDANPDVTTFGARNWQFKILPKTLLIPMENSYDDTPEARAYTVRPQFATEHLWGTAFTEAVEGFTRCQVVRGVSQHRPKLVAWEGDGVVTTFNFPATAQAVAIAKVKVWVNGVYDASAVITTAHVVPSVVPPDTAIVVALYEVA